MVRDPGVIERLAAQWRAFEQALQADPDRPIYAVTTLTGHRDREGVTGTPRAINRAIADSHFVTPVSAPDARLWRLVGLCKLSHLALGGVPVRPALFEALAGLVEAGETIGALDLQASYSSGDVIPACQWAIQSLDALGIPADDLAAGEMIALINGVFVHLGAALWAHERLEDSLARNVSQGARSLDRLARSERGGAGQAPVSVRAASQPQAAARTAMDLAGAAADRLLGAPSGNPLFHAGPPPRFESQASFMSCELAVAQSAVIEAVLALAWTINQRIKHLCAAHDDGGGADNPIALIQHPKRSEAVLQTLRLRNGTRPFASGGATSEGVEDFWSHGAYLSLSIAEMADGLDRMLALEAEVLTRLKGRASS